MLQEGSATALREWINFIITSHTARLKSIPTLSNPTEAEPFECQVANSVLRLTLAS